MQKITPFLWFNNNVAEATDFYTSAFKGSTIVEKRDIGGGRIQSATISIYGSEIILFNGGPMFTINPSISFFINRNSPEEIDELWAKFSEGGKILMPLSKYPFSEKFGWLQDKFGVSWQFNLASGDQGVAPFLLFVNDQQHGKAEEAIELYTSLFRNSSVVSKSYYAAGQGGEEGTIKHAIFKLDGLEFKTTDSNLTHAFTFNPAFSLFVNCETQEEVDHYWNKFLDSGGTKSRCGWLQDKYGVSWQIIPDALGKLMNDPDRAKSKRVLDAMLKMDKIDIKTLQQAYEAIA